jgi:predicted nucleic acid-binding protein
LSLYVDASALLKRYVDEPAVRVTGRHTIVEVRRNLVRLLEPDAAATMRAVFVDDLRKLFVVELDATLCDDAAEIAEQTGVRTLDALHLAAARRADEGITVLTFDRRQARAARALGLAAVGD